MSAIPITMNAFVLTGHGGMEKLVFHSDWKTPAPGPFEVLINVHACGLNNTDVNTRTGWYSKAVEGATTGDASSPDDEDAGWGGSPLTFPRIQGADVCGTVVAIGDGADQELMGKRVLVDTWLRDWNDPHNKYKTGYFGSECDGGFAEYVAVDYRQVHAVKSKMSHAKLATFATSWMTAEGMLNRANVTEGDRVLITGASGGVGSALIALANRRGAYTIAMTSPGKRKLVQSLQPNQIIGRDLKELNGDRVDVVADIVAGSIFTDLIQSLERGGRYVTSGAIAGPIVDLDIRTLYLHDLTLLGSTIVPVGTFANLVSYIERNEIKPVLAASFPLSELHAAQQAFIDKKHVGNIVVTMDV